MLFIHLVMGHLGFFPVFLAILNTATMNVLIHIFGKHMDIFWVGRPLGVDRCLEGNVHALLL